MLTMEQLEAFGADTREGLERCLYDEGFYLSLIPMAVETTGYDALEKAIEEKDLDRAFEAAHALKGILANVALTPILEPVMEATELLRARTDTDYTQILEKIREKRGELLAIIRSAG